MAATHHSIVKLRISLPAKIQTMSFIPFSHNTRSAWIFWLEQLFLLAQEHWGTETASCNQIYNSLRLQNKVLIPGGENFAIKLSCPLTKRGLQRTRKSYVQVRVFSGLEKVLCYDFQTENFLLSPVSRRGGETIPDHLGRSCDLILTVSMLYLNSQERRKQFGGGVCCLTRVFCSTQTPRYKNWRNLNSKRYTGSTKSIYLCLLLINLVTNY